MWRRCSAALAQQCVRADESVLCRVQVCANESNRSSRDAVIRRVHLCRLSLSTAGQYIDVVIDLTCVHVVSDSSTIDVLQLIALSQSLCVVMRIDDAHTVRVFTLPSGVEMHHVALTAPIAVLSSLSVPAAVRAGAYAHWTLVSDAHKLRFVQVHTMCM
jgi:hypothetical protein